MVIVHGDYEFDVRPLAKAGEPVSDELVESIYSINKSAWKSELGGTREQIKLRLEIAPEYQLGAFARKKGSETWELVGAINGLRGNVKRRGLFTKYFEGIPETYAEVTGKGTFINHELDGNALYCVTVARSF